MHNTYQDYKAISKLMLKSHLKLYVTQLPAALLATLVLLTFITQPAHADFLKALTAYQNRDVKTMLKEVQDAVDKKKNDDGLVLFLSVLEADTWMANLHAKVPTDKPLPPVEEFYKEKADLAAVSKKLSPIEKILPHDELLRFVDLLNTAAIQGNSVSQSRFFWLMRALGVVEIAKYEGVYEKVFVNTESTQRKLSEAMSTLYSWRSSSNDWNPHINDEAKGLELLKQALARPDAYLYWGQLSNTLSQYYYDKYQKKKNMYFLRQAYAWAVLNFTSNIFFNGHVYDGTPTMISEMQKKGLLIKIAPELNDVLSSYPDYQEYDQAKKRLRDMQLYQAILQSIQQVALPDLITENHKIDLKNQPVLSLSRINYDSWRTMMDGVYMTNAGTSILNFDIELYGDGRVVFSQGQSAFDESFRSSEILLKISPQEVSDLLAKAKSSGILESPRVAVGTQDYSYIRCASAECQISFASNYAITFRDKKPSKHISLSVVI